MSASPLLDLVSSTDKKSSCFAWLPVTGLKFSSSSKILSAMRSLIVSSNLAVIISFTSGEGRCVRSKSISTERALFFGRSFALASPLSNHGFSPTANSSSCRICPASFSCSFWKADFRTDSPRPYINLLVGPGLSSSLRCRLELFPKNFSSPKTALKCSPRPECISLGSSVTFLSYSFPSKKPGVEQTWSDFDRASLSSRSIWGWTLLAIRVPLLCAVSWKSNTGLSKFPMDNLERPGDFTSVSSCSEWSRRSSWSACGRPVAVYSHSVRPAATFSARKRRSCSKITSGTYGKPLICEIDLLAFPSKMPIWISVWAQICSDSRPHIWISENGRLAVSAEMHDVSCEKILLTASRAAATLFTCFDGDDRKCCSCRRTWEVSMSIELVSSIFFRFW